MTDRDESMARLLDRAAPEPPRLLDPAAIRGTRGRSSRPRMVRVLAPVLAAVVVAGVAGAVALSRGGHHSSAGPAPVGSAPPSMRVLSVEAGAIADRLLGAAGVPPGSRVAADPRNRLLGPGPRVGPPVVERSRFWIVAGSAASVTHYLGRHLPRGLALRVSSDDAGSPASYSRYYVADTRWQPPNASIPPPTVSMTVSQLRGGRSSIEIDVQLTLDPRQPQQTVPDTVTGVDVVIDRGQQAPVVRRSLGIADARALAGMVNTLGVEPVANVGLSCANSLFSITDRLVFRGPGDVRTVTITPGGGPTCNGRAATIRVGSRDVLPRLDATTLDKQMLRTVGLPADYGR